MSNLDISSWYVPEKEIAASDEITGDLAFQMPR
jgi:hypothetical protein